MYCPNRFGLKLPYRSLVTVQTVRVTRSELSRNPWQNIKYLQVRDPSNRAVAWPASMQIYGNKRTFFTKEKSSAPTGFVWKTNMAAVSLFWNTNMAAVKSCEYALAENLEKMISISEIPVGFFGPVRSSKVTVIT